MEALSIPDGVGDLHAVDSKELDAGTGQATLRESRARPCVASLRQVTEYTDCFVLEAT